MNPLTLLTLLTLLALQSLSIFGCSSFGGPDACGSQEDCGQNTGLVCDQGLGVCVRDADTLPCALDGAPDACGVGRACRAVEGVEDTGICVTRPLRIGAMVSRVGEEPQTRDLAGTQESVLKFVLERDIQPEIQDLGMSAQLIVERVSTDPVEQVEAARRLKSEAPDIVLSFTSDQYRVVQDIFAGTNVLHVGQSNRQTDVILQEQRQGAYPALGTLFGFSMAPIVYNDVATMAKFAREELGCTALQPVYEADGNERLYYSLLTKQESCRYGLAYVPALELPTTPLTDYALYVDQLRQSTQDHDKVCLLSAFIDDRALSPFLRAYESDAGAVSSQSFELIADGRFLDRDDQTSIDMRRLLRGTYGGSSQLYVYGNDDARAQFFVERFIQSAYRSHYDTSCEGIAGSCPLVTPEAMAQNALRVALAVDMITSSVLAAYAQRVQNRTSRLSLRDIYLELLSPEQTRSCSYPRIDSCYSNLRQRASVRYKGLSSDMILGPDARMRSLNETLTFKEVPSSWDGQRGALGEGATYSSAQMLDAYTGVALPPTCAKAPTP